MRVFTSRDDVDELAELTLSKHCFIKLYADWCGHCKAMQMSWDKAVVSLKNDTYLDLHDYEGMNEVIIAEVNDNVLSKMPEFIRQAVHGYPTIIEVQHGVIRNVYKGDRSNNDIYIWILINSDPKQLSDKSENDKDYADDSNETQSRDDNVCSDGPCNSQPEQMQPSIRPQLKPRSEPIPQQQLHDHARHQVLRSRPSMRKRKLGSMSFGQRYTRHHDFATTQNRPVSIRRFSMEDNHFNW